MTLEQEILSDKRVQNGLSLLKYIKVVQCVYTVEKRLMLDVYK